MGKSRHFFPGGNSRLGFYSFYHYLVRPTVKRKFILKGGPGVGKSHFMKEIAQCFLDRDYDIEYHWCSSDPESLDGIVIGSHQAAVLDGTAPHIIDPQNPGAVDEIIDLGQYWQHHLIAGQRSRVIDISEQISFCFQRAYHRLKESYLALEEWSVYLQKVRDKKIVYRNALALTEDFLQGTAAAEDAYMRHLFAGAITPVGIVLKPDHIIAADTDIFAVKGSPGSGVENLMEHVVHTLELLGINAEIYHNPLDPLSVDINFLPEYNRALMNTSDYLFPYAEHLATIRYRRQLDFDGLLPPDSLNPYAKRIALAQDRMDSGVNEAIEWIELAKHLHDQLEDIYIKAMDYSALNQKCEELKEDIQSLLND
ncbi:MAG: hypothetical protein WBJ34_02510 [Syntrophomonadaceae bacterium]